MSYQENRNIAQTHEKKAGVDKALSLGKKVNRITMLGGLAVGTLGVVTLNPGLVLGGYGSAVFDAGQNKVIGIVEKRRQRKKSVQMAKDRKYIIKA